MFMMCGTTQKITNCLYFGHIFMIMAHSTILFTGENQWTCSKFIRLHRFSLSPKLVNKVKMTFNCRIQAMVKNFNRTMYRQIMRIKLIEMK